MPGHMTTPSRVLVVISIVIAALVLLLASAVHAAGAGSDTTVHLVRSGDTLWAIAAELSPDGGDVREVVATIRTINGMDSSVIVPGQVIEIPIID